MTDGIMDSLEQRPRFPDMLYPDPPTEQARTAQQVKLDYAAQLEQIRRDPRRSQQAKAEDITALYAETADRLERHRERDLELTEQRQADLQRSAFGLGRTQPSPSDAISMRDASDRAARLTGPTAGADALELLQRARRNGDTVLERAVALQAYELGLSDVLDDFAEAHPDFAPQLAELDVLQAREGDIGYFAWFALSAPPENHPHFMALGQHGQRSR